MAIALKTRPTSPARDPEARANLAAAVAEHRAAQAELDDAVAAQEKANAEKWSKLTVIYDAEKKLDQAKRSLWEDSVIVAEAELAAAKEHDLPARQAAEAARIRVEEAQDRCDRATRHLTPAAQAVVQAEIEPVAAELTAQFRAAMETIVTTGAAIRCLIETGAVSGGELRNLYSILYTNPAGWPGFDQRYATSPFRSVVSVLEMDASASLPVVSL